MIHSVIHAIFTVVPHPPASVLVVVGCVVLVFAGRRWA